MKSWLRSAALAVASAVAITGVPAIANAAPTAPTASTTHAADTSSIQEKQHALKDTLVHAAKTFEGATTSPDGNTLTLKHGLFTINKKDSTLEIIDSAGKTITTLPLKGIFNKSVYSLHASLSDSHKTVTLTRGEFLSKATPVQLHGVEKFKKNTSAWIKLYGDYASYALQHDPLAFVGGTVLGIVGGNIISSIAFSATDATLKFVNGVLSQIAVVGAPAAIVIDIITWNVFYNPTIIALYITLIANTPALLSAKLAKDPVPRHKAQRLLDGTKAYLTFGDVPRV